MPILWPDQSLEPPDEYQHYAECALHEDMDLPEDGTALCECSAIESSRQQDAADQAYQRRKDEGLDI